MAGEDGLDLRIAQMHGDDFGQDVAEIGGVQEVAAFVELVLFQAGPAREHGLDDAARAVFRRE